MKGEKKGKGEIVKIEKEKWNKEISKTLAFLHSVKSEKKNSIAKAKKALVWKKALT